MLTLTVQSIVIFISTSREPLSLLNTRLHNPGIFYRKAERRSTLLSHINHILLCHLVKSFHSTVNYDLSAIFRFARLSILFSLIRIAEGARRRLSTFFCFAAFFFLTWVFLVVQLFWVCEPKTAWKHMERPRCDIGYLVPICQLVSKRTVFFVEGLAGFPMMMKAPCTNTDTQQT